MDAAAAGAGSCAAEYGGVPQQSALVLFVMAVRMFLVSWRPGAHPFVHCCIWSGRMPADTRMCRSHCEVLPIRRSTCLSLRQPLPYAGRNGCLSVLRVAVCVRDICSCLCRCVLWRSSQVRCLFLVRARSMRHVACCGGCRCEGMLQDAVLHDATQCVDVVVRHPSDSWLESGAWSWRCRPGCSGWCCENTSTGSFKAPRDWHG